MSQRTPDAVAGDGMLSSLGGMDGGKDPSLINPNQVACMVNATARNGYIATRPGWIKRALSFSRNDDQTLFQLGNPQGLGFYQTGQNFLIANIDGCQFAIDVCNNFNVSNITPAGTPNPKDLPKAYMCQAADYFVIQDGESPPIYFKGLSGTRTTGKDTDIPVGTAMAYGWGRLWVARDNQFTAGDIVGGSTNVVTFSEDNFLSEGGAFRLTANMGNINGMAFIPLQDTATGQGQLLIGADYGVASVNGSIPRAVWKETQGFQQVALLDVGWSSQDGAVLLNGDIFYRSPDGIRSYRMARAQQGFNGNTPQSNEVQQWVNTDTQQFLQFASGVYFNGRVLITTAPQFAGTYCYHKGLLALDSQPQQSIQSKAPPVWDGLWDGLNIVQIVKGTFNSTERCFALVRKIDDTSYGKVGLVTGLTFVVQDTDIFEVGQNIGIQNAGMFKVDSIGASDITVVPLRQTGTITQGSTINGGEYNELWELTVDSPFDIVDNEKRRIQSKVWTRSFTHQNPFGLKQLTHGMWWRDQIIGTVDWSISYRPDQYPCMIPWKTGQDCSEDEVCNEQCPTNLNRHPTYKPAVIFSAKSECLPNASYLSDKGYEFQWLIEWTGHMRIRAIKEICIDAKEPVFGTC